MIYFSPGPVLDRKLQGNCFEDSRTLPGALWSGVIVAWRRLIRKEKPNSAGSRGGYYRRVIKTPLNR
jgi:hypothetical protein